MENSDLGIYTVVVVGLFIMFGIGTFNEFRTMDTNQYKGTERDNDTGVFRAFIKKIFS